MEIWAVRGATQARENSKEEILSATEELMKALIDTNQLVESCVISAIFTVTEDLTMAFPAEAARRHGWSQVPMMCAREIPVPGSHARTIRVMIHFRSQNLPQGPRAVYLRGTEVLRPDLHEGRG